MASVTVERAKDYVGVFRSYWVVIDGAKVGRVKRGKSLTVDVEPAKAMAVNALSLSDLSNRPPN